MKHILLATALTLSASPGLSQDVHDDGFSLMEEGARLLLRGLMTEMEPALDELEGFAKDVGPAIQRLAEEMGPALAETLNAIDDIRNYDTPELMPNGDIIIRRRVDAPKFDPPSEIEL